MKSLTRAIAVGALGIGLLTFPTVAVASPSTTFISGTVTGPGGPAAHVTVEAFGDAGARGFAVTDTTGHYSMTLLTPDTYHLVFDPSDDLSLAYQWFPGVASRSASAPIAVTDGSTTLADATLVAAVSVSGTVTLPGGAPAFVLVAAGGHGDPFPWQPYRSTFTDDTGHYTISGLPPGDVDVLFDAIGSYAPQFWNAQTTPATATAVSLTSGTAVTGINATLTTSTRRVSITSITPSVFDPNTVTDVVIHGTGLGINAGGADLGMFQGGFVQVISSTNTEITGKFHVADAVPGSFFSSAPGLDTLHVTFNGGVFNAFGSDGADCIDCITITGTPSPTNVGGVVHDTTGAVLAGATVTLTPFTAGSPTLTAVTAADGTYSITGAPTRAFVTSFSKTGYITSFYTEANLSHSTESIAVATPLIVLPLRGGNYYGGTLRLSPVSPPSVTSVRPSKIETGDSTVLILNGLNLSPITSVTISGTGVAVTSVRVLGSTKIAVTVRASRRAALGTRILTVTRSDGMTATTTVRVAR